MTILLAGNPKIYVHSVSFAASIRSNDIKSLILKLRKELGAIAIGRMGISTYMYCGAR